MDYFVKIALFLPFMGLVYLFVDYFKGILTSSISSVPYSGYICQFGLFDGLSVYFTIIISSFVVRQALSFMK